MKHCIKDIEREFNELCDALAPTNFIKFLNSGNIDDFHDWSTTFHSGNWDTALRVNMYSGCSRFVLAPWDGDYVFKIQYDIGNIDYCDNEFKVYSLAEKRGVEKFFAWITPIAQFDSVTVYAMERIDVNEQQNSDDSYYYHLDLWREEHGDEEYYEDEYELHEGMLDFARAHNGKEMQGAIDLIYDLCINDLHCGNWGYRGDTFVVVDYGGYGQQLNF